MPKCGGGGGVIYILFRRVNVTQNKREREGEGGGESKQQRGDESKPIDRARDTVKMQMPLHQRESKHHRQKYIELCISVLILFIIPRGKYN